MNIKEFKLLIETALHEEDFSPARLGKRKLTRWSLPGDEIARWFFPHALRRPWGLRLTGVIGIDIRPFRTWLDQNKSGDELGIFHTCFVSYHLANDAVLGSFDIIHGDPVPADLWAGLIKDRLLEIPTTFHDLLTIYLTNREELGWLAHPHNKHQWDFLQRWLADPDPALRVPRMMPDGRII